MSGGMIGALIIAYHPPPGQVESLIDSLRGQLDQVLVIDNSQPASGIKWADNSESTLLEPGTNLGVAEAINRGVARLANSGCKRVLLLDQDSVPASDLVAGLARCMDQALGEGRAIAAAGPVIRDQDSGQDAPFLRFGLPRNQRLRGSQGSVSCDFLISSGCLLNLDAWQQIGPMRSGWFIDNIDLEWSFRARRQGFELLGCFDVHLDHAIGETRFLLPGHRLPYRHHGPARLYTMMRNRLWLYRSGAPWSWIIRDSLRAAIKFICFSLLVRPRLANAGAMLRGLRDGLVRRPAA
ncbi:MAG: glycosyltransferase family 2 protein [Wenzhouxiangellaceae bacterium]|nr:MAG: glycosyltransferase family 2 protein [Wenzhouxiangellaceae bacterium]